MNYIIEDNLDFKAALLLDDDASNDTEGGVCLITQQPLTNSHIKLPCSHAFNYMALYKELVIQKTKNSYETTHLKVFQIKCPYCRNVSDNLLPYLPSECTRMVNGVNSPTKYCMPYLVTCHGKIKEKPCPFNACYIGETSYCKRHYLKTQKKLKEAQAQAQAQAVGAQAQAVGQQQEEAIEWTTEMKNIYKTKNLIELKQLLRLHKLKVGGNKKELVERMFTNKLSF
jgi:hypothetical protein